MTSGEFELQRRDICISPYFREGLAGEEPVDALTSRFLAHDREVTQPHLPSWFKYLRMGLVNPVVLPLLLEVELREPGLTDRLIRQGHRRIRRVAKRLSKQFPGVMSSIYDRKTFEEEGVQIRVVDGEKIFGLVTHGKRPWCSNYYHPYDKIGGAHVPSDF